MRPLKNKHWIKFWELIDDSAREDCWPWRGCKDSSGYGRYKRRSTHRLSYEWINGAIPEGMEIRHRCDNPACCNPDHLLTGTHAENMADAVERKRTAAGSKNGKAKLNDDQVDYIKRNPDRLKLDELARRNGVSQSAIQKIRSGERRKAR